MKAASHRQEKAAPQKSALKQVGDLRESTERATITLKKLQSSVAGSGVMLYQSTISRALRSTGSYGRVARNKLLPKMYQLKVCQKA